MVLNDRLEDRESPRYISDKKQSLANTPKTVTCTQIIQHYLNLQFSSLIRKARQGAKTKAENLREVNTLLSTEAHYRGKQMMISNSKL